MIVYDFKTGNFTSISGDHHFDDSILKKGGEQSNVKHKEDGESPTQHKKRQALQASPTKLGGSYGSPSKSLKSPAKLTAKARKAGKSPKKTGDHAGQDKVEVKESGLASPTSISMQNSFIIKNADESFELYHA